MYPPADCIRLGLVGTPEVTFFWAPGVSRRYLLGSAHARRWSDHRLSWRSIMAWCNDVLHCFLLTKYLLWGANCTSKILGRCDV